MAAVLLRIWPADGVQPLAVVQAASIMFSPVGLTCRGKCPQPETHLGSWSARGPVLSTPVTCTHAALLHLLAG